jgi:hypothetical protein
MRRTLGTAVFSGMIGVTMFGIFLTPVFSDVIMWLADCGAPAGKGKAVPVEDVADGQEGQVLAAAGAGTGITPQPNPHAPEPGKD